MKRLLLAAGVLILGALGVPDMASSHSTGDATFAAMPGQTGNPTGIVFTKSEQTLGNTRTMSIAIEDVDLDDDNDIFITNYIGTSVLWLNDGNGTFSQSPQSFSISQVHGVGIRDLNGDEYPDIFLLSHAGPSKVYFNNGSGAFTPGAQDIGSGAENPGWVTLGDVDNDDDIDAFITYYQLPNRLWLNDGEGFFTVTETEYGGNNSWSMALANVNGDSFPDLFLCLSDQADEVWLNDGAGNFVNSGQQLGGGSGYEGSVGCGDVDGDGDIDFAVANSVAGVAIWLNQNNTGSFVQAGPYFEAGAIRAALFDADLDGDLDLITAHAQNGNKLWLNQGAASFVSLGQLFGTARALSIATGRLDQDEDLDVVLGMLENSGGNPAYFNESYVCGDANGDDAVDISDPVYLITYIFAGGSAPNPYLSGDADCSSNVDISDAVFLISYIFAGGPRPDCLPATDIDGNVYQTVTIGTQVWMVENLKVTRYRNGDAIPNVPVDVTWAGLTTGAYCEYNNDIANVADYGRLYNWYAVADSRNIAPAGWHVANDTEWQTLVDYLGGDAVAGWKMKETGTAHWLPPNSGTNECGFTALPGGYRGSNYSVFGDLGNYACFWTSAASSSSYAWYRSISYDYSEVSHYDSRKFYGFSVRCVKD